MENNNQPKSEATPATHNTIIDQNYNMMDQVTYHQLDEARIAQSGKPDDAPIVLSGRMRVIDLTKKHGDDMDFPSPSERLMDPLVPVEVKTWVVLAPSAYRPSVMCIVGEGKTENEAWCDAVGEEWNKCVTYALIKKFYAKYEGKRGYVVRQVSRAEYDEIQSAENN
jgi:hypothetical protein